MRSYLLALLLACSLSPAGPASAQRRSRSPKADQRPTPAQLREVGTMIVRTTIARHGESKDTAVVNLVAEVLEPLRKAAGFTRRDFEWHVVDSDEVNAFAAPGGFMVVYSGLVRQFREFAQQDRPNDPVAQRKRLESFVAATLGHELGHLLLGHTDSLDAYLPRGPVTKPMSREALIEQVMRDPDQLRDYRHTREQELAADRMGGLLALRAGWDIQSGLDLFRHMAVVEQEGEGRAIDAVSWWRDHPRMSEREGRLEAFRGTLKLDQANFDDAHAAVENGVFLDTAVVLLDTVLKHFPDNKEALHLRAAAFHRKFLREASARALLVRSTVPTYDSRLLETIRGAFTHAAEVARDSARSAYRATLRNSVLPYSLSNLAVLDAYAGDLRSAVARADSAVALDSTDATIRLNRGVVRYLARNYAGALTDFQTVQQHLPEPSPVAMFDIGRTQLALGDTARGRETLRRYATADDEGPWHDLAIALVGSRTLAPASPPSDGTLSRRTPRSSAGIATPIAIGAAPSDVRRILGAPDQAGSRGAGTIWFYGAKGVAVFLTEEVGVIAVALLTPTAGSIDGIRVGDATSKARETWGPAIDGDESTQYFRRGSLIVVVDDDGGTVARLSIGRQQK